MILAFSSMSSGLRSFFKSSQANQKRMFSSLYSHRRNERKTFLPSVNDDYILNMNSVTSIESHSLSLAMSFSKESPHDLISTLDMLLQKQKK